MEGSVNLIESKLGHFLEGDSGICKALSPNLKPIQKLAPECKEFPVL